MEHQTIIAYGSSFENNEFGLDWLHFHELAHEWWANLVTARDWKDFWIHESFASYMEALAAEAFNDPAAYHRYMARMRSGIRNAKPVAPREPRSTRQMYFSADGSSSDGDIYVKGAWILHTLRHLIGVDALKASLRRMAYPTPEMEMVTDGDQVRLVDTSDFVKIVESESGEDLGWFFDLYLRQPDLPELTALREGGSLTLRWKTPDNLPFPMPVDIEVDGMARRVNIPADGVSIAIPEGADVELDPDNWILKAE
jgi:aminopeptidase N